MKTPKKGSETPVYLASASEVEGVTGKYFMDKKPVKSSRESNDPLLAQQLWDYTVKLLGLENDQTRAA